MLTTSFGQSIRRNQHCINLRSHLGSAASFVLNQPQKYNIRDTNNAFTKKRRSITFSLANSNTQTYVLWQNIQKLDYLKPPWNTEKNKNNPSSRIWTSDLRMSAFWNQLQSSALPTELSRVRWKLAMHTRIWDSAATVLNSTSHSHYSYMVRISNKCIQK